MSTFALASSLGLGTVIAAARARRGWQFAVFATVLLGVHTLITIALWPHVAAAGLGVVFAALQGVVYLHYLRLSAPRMRGRLYRGLVSLPGSWFAAGTFLALPWAIAAAVGLPPLGWGLPYALALVGLVQSLREVRSDVDLVLDGQDTGALSRQDTGNRTAGTARPLRIVQITDPHLGPFMSVERLRAIAQRAVDADPDLILLTGDYLTMESKATPGCLAEALAPLAAMEGRTFACRGNHDLEAPRKVAEELAAVGVKLLIDDAVVVQTDAGPVQILGLDFTWRDRARRMAETCAQHPRQDDALRIVLLHDPSAFAHLPQGEGDLVLSGHTHGGQVGLVSLGLPWTAVSATSSTPDHGFWSRGTDRLYVHRANGHYGFPLRLGVPNEEGVLHIHRPGPG